MINSKKIVVTSNNRYYGNQQNEYYVVKESDLEIIEQWLDKNQTDFAAFSGKVMFMKDANFPRYKFTEYGKNNNNIVQITRTSAYADAIVIDCKEWKNILKSYVSRSRIFQQIGVTVDEKEEYIEFPKETDLNSAPNLVKYGVVNHYRDTIINSVQTIIEAYNEFAGTKIINVLDLSSVINKSAGPLNAEITAQLLPLLKSSDSDTVKLGMEMLTNYDIESSLLHLLVIQASKGIKLDYNNYWSSVNFKAFRDKFKQLTGYTFDYNSNTVYDAVTNFLEKDNLILEEDVIFIENVIKEELMSSYSLEGHGFCIETLQIKLKIKPEQIIKMTSVSAEEALV